MDRRRRVLSTWLIVSSVSAAATADAAPCDDANDAWHVIEIGLEAQRHGDARAIEHAVDVLTSARCVPSGANIDLVARARFEARLLVLELHADAARAALSHAPRQTARGGEGYRQWVARAITPWITAQLTSVRAVTSEATSLAHDTVDDSTGVAVDALSALVSLEMDLAIAVDRLPVPAEIERDPELLRAYRTTIQDGTQSIVDSVRDGYRSIASRSQRSAVIPREARRAEAWLLLHGRITAAERAGGQRSVAHASSGNSTAVRAVVEPGSARTSTDASVSPANVRDVVNLAMPALIDCHEHSLDREPTLQGDVSVRFVVTVDGTVSQAQVTRGDGSLRVVAQCIANTIHGLTFPLVHSPLTVDYPFHLEPSAPASNLTSP